MKTILIIISAVVILSNPAFSQNSRVKELLEKPDTRKEVINSILNNHEYMSEFIQAMHGNQHAALMMNGNGQTTANQSYSGMNGSGQMMGNQGQMGMNGNNHIMDQDQDQNQNQNQMMSHNQMLSRSYFMNMMHSNPGMMEMMMGNMMNTVSTDSSMSNYMINIMTENPRMLQIMKQHLGTMHLGFNNADSKHYNQLKK